MWCSCSLLAPNRTFVSQSYLSRSNKNSNKPSVLQLFCNHAFMLNMNSCKPKIKCIPLLYATVACLFTSFSEGRPVQEDTSTLVLKVSIQNNCVVVFRPGNGFQNYSTCFAHGYPRLYLLDPSPPILSFFIAMLHPLLATSPNTCLETRRQAFSRGRNRSLTNVNRKYNSWN